MPTVMQRIFDRLTTRWGLLAVLLLMPLPLAAEASNPPLPQVGNCYSLRVVEPLPGSARLGFLDQDKPWWMFFCPAGETPVLDRRSPIHDVLEDLARTTAGDPASWAAMLSLDPSNQLERRLCQSVTYTRSFESYQGDPRPTRSRPAHEIKAWLLDLTGPTRPIQARLWHSTVATARAKDLKRAHDGLKAVWPQVAGLACPELED